MKHSLRALALAGVLILAGCQSYGPVPETVASVDINQYAGLWYEIASNPQFFNENLVGVTAEYTVREDGTVKVVNRGFEGSLNGPQTSIEGSARVVDASTNSKLAVSFPSVPFSGLFPGEYWIVLLDEEYQYAVVTDSRQSSLFVLYRSGSIERADYDAILAALEAKNIDLSRLRVTGTIVE